MKLQNDAAVDDTLIFSVVDLHSLTSRSQDVRERRLAKRQTLAILLAAGLRPERCTLFHQSSVPQHAELHWILSCDAGMGWLSRMPTWKEKLLSEHSAQAQRDGSVNIDIASLLQPSPNPRSQERLKLGLFSYPVLQAADILLYRATDVPVGEDQLVHIEFARAAATSFNAVYGGGGEVDSLTGKKRKGMEILVLPEAMVGKAKRVMSLVEPEKKMSKSEKNERGRILVTDEEDVIKKKFKGAVTDSLDQNGEGITYDPERRPGVSNLLEVIANVEDAEGRSRNPQDVAQEFQNLQVTGSALRVLKERAAEVVVAHLQPIRERYKQMLGQANGKFLDDIAEHGQVKAEARAVANMRNVREVIGL